MISIREAAQFLGVVPQTLRRWEREGKIFPDERTPGGKRRYNIASLEKFVATSKTFTKTKKIFAYARVPSPKLSKDLQQQKQLLEMFCAKQGWVYELVSETASGVEYNRVGLTKILQQIFANQVSHFLITHQDSLFTYGNEMFFQICKTKNVQIIVLNNSTQPSCLNILKEDSLTVIADLQQKISQNSLGELTFNQFQGEKKQ